MAFLFIFLLVVWGAALSIVTKPATTNTPTEYRIRADALARALGLQKVQHKAQCSDVEMTAGIYISLVIGSFMIGLLISIVSGNYFFIALGVLLGYTVPLHLMKVSQRNRRNELLFEVPEYLKIMTSKLLDFSNASYAMNEALEDYNGSMKKMMQEAADSLRLGFSLETVLTELKAKIRLRRFDEFADKLLAAEVNGYTERAVASLKATIRGMGEDAVYVKKLQIQAKAEMKSTYVQALLILCLPILLSFVNTNSVNIFTGTLLGQIYITFLVGVIMFCILKKYDCLSLNLNEL